MLSALGRAIEAKAVDIGIDQSQIKGYYLFNEKEEGNLRYKQLLTKHDKDTLIQLLEKGEAPDNTSLLVKNYQFFEDELKHTDLEVVYKGLEKLMIVSIALTRGSDNPQLIFESLNSTGRRLSQADLIRNYVLMGQELNFQNRLYDTCWYPMERSFGTEYNKRFDLFIRDYLTLKTRKIPNKGKVYESFKRYVEDKRGPKALEATIAEIARYSRYYVSIALLQEDDPEFLACFEDIHALNVETVFPFLLEVYEDYMQGQLEQKAVTDILRLIESYIFRRAICGIETRGLNRIFATLMSKIDKDNYLESLKHALTQMPSSQRYPSDTEFKENFCIKDVYNFHSCRYLLRKLENHEHSKELINLEHCTIEHIMPQNPDLSEKWQEELGGNWREVQEKYLHTIGNLTLTGYNSELGDRPFKEKQEMPSGFCDSPLHLNRSLTEVERWDEIAIIDRTEILAEKACEIWPYHGVAQEIQERPEGYWTLADHRYLPGEMMELFQQLRKRILNLNVSVSEGITKRYIGYSMNTIFVAIMPQAKRLLLSLNLPFSDINDPRSWCRDVTNVSRDATGDVAVGISSVDDLDYIMFLVRQAFEKQKGGRQEQGGDWVLADHHHLNGEMMELFLQLQDRIRNLHTSVSRSIAQRYIAFKAVKNFVAIEPQNGCLRVSVSVPYPELDDPEHRCRDTTGRGRSGMLLGSEVFLNSTDELDYIMFLIHQAFERQIADR